MRRFRRLIDDVYQNGAIQVESMWRVIPGMMDKRGFTAYLWRMHWDDEIDATGMLCPLPVLKARKRLKAMAKGAVLRLVATDPAAVIDVPHYCVESGNVLLSAEVEAVPQIYLIKRS